MTLDVTVTVDGDGGALQRALDDARDAGGKATLGELLAAHPAARVSGSGSLAPGLLHRPVAELTVLVRQPAAVTGPAAASPAAPPRAQDGPPGDAPPATPTAAGTGTRPQVGASAPRSQGVAAPANTGPPDARTAVRLAYGAEIDAVASVLKARLSVLVVCEKLVVRHLWEEIVGRAHFPEAARALLDVPEEEPGALVPRSLRQRQLARLRDLVRALKPGHVLIVPHLDLLAGGAEASPPAEAREVIELLYERTDCLLLALADPSLELPDVLSRRFAVRVAASGVPRLASDGRLLGEALVAPEEAARFEGFDAGALYKHVGGMNPVRLRDAIAYAIGERASHGRRPPVRELYEAIRLFKVQTSTSFEVPDVTFDDVGGYAQVKHELERAIKLMEGAFALDDERLRRELIPRGFVFHGPPGTGKTLFAKAIASRLHATVQVVSGPEVTDMYVGEGERKVRELFAAARRNAPSVLVFDEFDSIAARRTGRDDGGSRAGNALVAQVLTEMDGFRPDVPMLVIGTTNRLDMIDEALLRPSRFQAVHIGLPDRPARRAIVEIHARHFGFVKAEALPAALLDLLADVTEGLNGDELRSLFRDARVGVACNGVAADARRFGALVGRLRAAHEEREAAQAQARAERGGQPARRQAPQGSPSAAAAPAEPGFVPLVGGGEAGDAEVGR